MGTSVYIFYILVLALFLSVFFVSFRILSRIRLLSAVCDRWRFVRWGVSVIVAVFVLLGALNFYVYHGLGDQPDIFRKGDPSKLWVAITFDDGPSPIWTPRILHVLNEYKVPATFFMVGAHVVSYPDVALRVAVEGHELGNHTFDHINIPSTSTAELSSQLLRTTWAIYDATGQMPTFFRPPRGMYDTRIRRLAELLGQPIVLWTVSGQDWLPGTTVEQIVKRVVSQTKAGDILLFHDSGALIANQGANRESTVRALPAIIEGIRKKGFEFVSLDQLLQYAEPIELTEQEMLELRE